MLLKHPSDRLRSLTELKRYSSLNSLKMTSSDQENPSQLKLSSSMKKRNLEFIPFCQQRNIGRLISDKNKLTRSRQKCINGNGLVQMMNFKNFKKLYNIQKKNQQVKYAMRIRNSGQKNLIDQSQWLFKSVTKKRSSQYISTNSKFLLQDDGMNTLKRNSIPTHLDKYNKNCHQHNNKQTMQQILSKKNQNFNKIDLQLYKKIALNRPPNQQNTQLNHLFKHYVQVCELNQNERRLFLTNKRVK